MYFFLLCLITELNVGESNQIVTPQLDFPFLVLTDPKEQSAQPNSDQLIAIWLSTDLTRTLAKNLASPQTPILKTLRRLVPVVVVGVHRLP